MLSVGLLGAPASGKSLVASEFAKLGAVIFDADQVAHRVLLQPVVQARLTEIFGNQVLTSTGEVNRERIADLVFAEDELSRQRRRYLEQLIHALVLQECLREQIRQRDVGIPVFVIDAPLLLEAGWSTLCERLIYIDAPIEVRYHRAAMRGWTSQALDRREKWLISRNSKKVRADFVINNSGSIADLRKQVTDVWQSLLTLRIP